MLSRIERVTGFVSAHLTKLILAVMVLGLLNAYFLGGIPFNLGICAAASFLMIYPMFINVKVGDVVEIKEASRQLVIVLESQGLAERDVPDFYEVDHSKGVAKMTRIPLPSEVPYPVQMEPNLVIEFYSR